MTEPAKKIRILVTDAGSLNALGIIRQLGILGRFEIYAVAYNHLAMGRFSRYCRQFYTVPHPKTAPSEFVNRMKSLIADHNIGFLMPVGYYAHKAVIGNKADLEKLCAVCAPDLHAFDIATSKILTAELAEKAGVLTPKTFVISDFSQVETLVAPRFPLVIKSRNEIGGRMLAYASSHEELKEKFGDMIKTYKLLPADYPIIQEYIEGEGVGFFAYYNSGHVKAFFMHERVREFPVSGGRSVCARSFYDEALKLAGEAVLNALSWHGCAMVEFKRTADNKYYLLEVNPKLWGSLELAIVSGVNFPLLMVEDGLKIPRTQVTSYKKGVYFQWCINGELYHLINRPWAVLNILRTALSSKKDLWLRDPAPNLMQVLLVFIDLYKFIKAKFR